MVVFSKILAAASLTSQKNFVQRPMIGVLRDQPAQLFRVTHGRQRPIRPMRLMSLNGISAGSRRSWYPPRAPRTLSTMRAFFISSRMSSRNFSGRSLSAAISRIFMAPWSCFRAKVIMACSAYSPFCEIFKRSVLPAPPRLCPFSSFLHRTTSLLIRRRRAT